ncbi:helicase-related protein [Haliangium sp.]|uniref:helicase-related protein n=1 Tax=Haliangium sp. TaxID=2663208 RepID=UPI003D0D460A
MSSVTAVLAPTNTGKTHRAVERMLEHDTGMLGLPLRLLAREVYDRVTALLGESEVALVTGEEKRVPPRARYWVCTVESMPVSREVDFLAVDEIQLAAHHQRGHVFTSRLLEARGRLETWFLGAETMRPILRELVPEARIHRYERLSDLRYTGVRSLRTLPPRTAVVAFSVPDVYELAERLRQRRGGVAVVLGALSPRTRNAQVALYQSGEVEYMVATDAIGMGLNMDVDHVAFAALRKYDGREQRYLVPAELAQIAGRAGRYLSNGSFGNLAPLPELPPGVARAIENHHFPPVERLKWRNTALDTRSVDALIVSLKRTPDRPGLELTSQAEDFSALVALAERRDIRDRAQDPKAVALLWEVCQIPDFRKLLEDSHVRLLGEIFLQLSGPKARIDRDWMHRHIARLDDVRGDIDLLTRRLAFIRTWTYVSHRSRWVDDDGYFRERTRVIEDRLSDALHERLVQRFVERELRRSAQRGAAATDIDENHPFYKLAALRVGGAPAPGPDEWVEELIEAGYERFRVDGRGVIRYGDEDVARMTRGADLLRPEVTVTRADLGPGAITRVRRRLMAWTRDLVAEVMGPMRHPRADELSPAGRGLLYQLEQGLGTIRRRDARLQLRDVGDADRKLLRALGVRLGGQLVYVPSLLTPAAIERRLALHAALYGPAFSLDLGPGAVSLEARDSIPLAVYRALGYPVFGTRAIRADMAERVHRALGEAARAGAFEPPRALAAWLGCPAHALPEIIEDFGYRALADGRFAPRRRRRDRRRRSRRRGSDRQDGAGRDRSG